MRSASVGWGSFAIMIGTIEMEIFVTRYQRRSELRSRPARRRRHTQSSLYASAAVVAWLVAVQQDGLGRSGGNLILVGFIGHPRLGDLRPAYVLFDTTGSTSRSR